MKPKKWTVTIGTVGSSGSKEIAPAELPNACRMLSRTVGSKPIAFLGIDPGLVQLTAMLVVRGSKRRAILRYVLKTKPVRGVKPWIGNVARTVWLHHHLLEYLKVVKETWPKLYILLEGYSMGSGGSAVQSMAEVKQSILTAIIRVDPKFEHVLLMPPTSWKACFLGEDNKRGQDKWVVANHVIDRWPIVENTFQNDDNQYDAYAMAALYEQLILRPFITNKSIERLRLRESDRKCLDGGLRKKRGS